MMIPSEVLTKIWNDISGEGHSAQGCYFRRLPAEAARFAYAGIAVPTGRRILAIESPLQNVSVPKILNHSHGFSVEVSTESIEGQTLTVISLIETGCDSPGLFEEVAVDILSILSNCKDAMAIPCRILRRLENWHRFFKNDTGMGRQEYLGLFAELLLMERILNWGLNAEVLLTAWQGPLGGSQDFHFGLRAVEVKCSSGVDPGKVRISSTRQLDSTGLDSLFLFHASTDFRENSGRTLVALYHELRQRIADTDSENSALFEDLILSAGFNEKYVGRYEQYGVTIRETAFYEIRDGFPTIDESLLGPGISDVSFSLDLSSCQDYKVSESYVEMSIRRTEGNG